ncbi:hypothetical protein [Reyranella sp.]|uniref:hypothetical protein n=1 Tax=Reyranella sp. TaxID=1929291 RepID=UPI003BAA8968
MTDQPPANAERISGAKLERRKERRAERKRRQAEMARSSALIEQTSARPLVRATGTLVQSSTPLGPFAKYMGRIGGRMIMNQVVRMIFNALLRR